MVEGVLVAQFSIKPADENYYLGLRRPAKFRLRLQVEFETCPLGVVEFILGSLKLTA